MGIISLSTTYYIGAFINKGLLPYLILGTILPLFIISDFLRRTKQYILPYTISAVLLGSYSILVATTTLGYIALLFGFPHQLTLQVIVALTVLLIAAALITNARGPKLITIDLSPKKPFSHRKERLTIIHLSDIHLTQHTRISWIHSLVKNINDLSPDLILFTGDLIDTDPKNIPKHIQELSKLNARYGKFAVSGNHDVMTGINIFYDLCTTLGFTCLDHKQAHVASLTLLGMPDEMIPTKILPISETQPENTPVIFLKHRPTRFKEAVKAGIHLQLSGHSHQGQIPPWGLLVKMRYRQYAYGLHSYKTGHIFTTRGTGIWGPPMRLFGRSEIIKITI